MKCFAQISEMFASAIVRRCEKGNCSLSLDGLSQENTLIIDADEYKSLSKCTGKICDFIALIAVGRLIGVVVEMKGGKASAGESAQQIEQGAVELDRVLSSQAIDSFRPILACNSMKSIERKALDKQRVQFRGRAHRIIPARCGARLIELL